MLLKKKSASFWNCIISPCNGRGRGNSYSNPALQTGKGKEEETCIKLTFAGDDTVRNMLGQLKLLLLPELADLVDTELEIVLGYGTEIDLVDQLAVLFKVIGQKIRHCELSVWVKGFIHSNKDGFPVPFL